MRWKTFAFLYDKFTQDNTCQIYQNRSGLAKEVTKHFGVLLVRSVENKFILGMRVHVHNSLVYSISHTKVIGKGQGHMNKMFNGLVGVTKTHIQCRRRVCA